MSDDQIDLDRVVTDPDYRRRVIAYLNATAGYGSQGRRSARVEAPRQYGAGMST